MLAAAYPRYSSDNQREESIEAQMRAIRAYAEREGHTIVAVYPEVARSATTDNRPQFQQMMADAAAGKFECIIVHKLDRFSRDRYDSAFYKRLLKRCGVRLLSVLENLDGSPESIMLESVLEGMAEYYSRNLAREVIKGMRETAYQCKHTGGLPPLGYDVTPEKDYAINEYEAEAVRLIFDMYASGSGYNAIIDTLAEKGNKTKTGKPFGKNSLHNILSNEKYRGTYIFNRAAAKVAGTRNNHQSKSEEDIIRIPDGMPAIITDDVWERVRSRMEDNRHTQGSYTAKTVYILSSHIFCGDCGCSMTGKRSRNGRNKTEYSYYECGARKRTRSCKMKEIRRDYIEELVLNVLYENIFSPKAMLKAARRIYDYEQQSKKEIPSHLKSIKKELATVDKEINNIVDAIGKGMFHESMKARMDDLESKKLMLVNRIQEAERQGNINNKSPEEIKTYLSRWTNIKHMSPEEQKQAVEMFVYRVVIHTDDVEIDVRPWSSESSEPDPDDGGSYGNKKSPHSKGSDGETSGGGSELMGASPVSEELQCLNCTNLKPRFSTSVAPKGMSVKVEQGATEEGGVSMPLNLMPMENRTGVAPCLDAARLHQRIPNKG